MIVILVFSKAAGSDGHVSKTLASALVKPHNPGLMRVFRPNAPSRAIA
jgi:hypothetical protein